MDIVILLNIFLGSVLCLSSVYYYLKIRTWIALASALVGGWIAITYLSRVYLVPEYISHGFWGVWMVRPAFTLTLILMSAKAVAGYRRVR